MRWPGKRWQCEIRTLRYSPTRVWGGPADTSISSGELLVQGVTRGGEAVIENLADDDYMVQVPGAHSS